LTEEFIISVGVKKQFEKNPFTERFGCPLKNNIRKSAQPGQLTGLIIRRRRVVFVRTASTKAAAALSSKRSNMCGMISAAWSA
jgi:hypothetical protein